MSSNDRPTENELAQTYFADLIRNPAARPDPALDPETARLIRELVSTEQASGRAAAGRNFAAISRRIRENVQSPMASESGFAQPARPGLAEPVHIENEPFATRRATGLAWNKFATLAGMAATIVLLVGILVLSLAAVGRTPKATPAVGANPASNPTVQPQPTPTPTATVRPKPTAKGGDDLLNPKSYLNAVLLDVAKSISLDQAALLKQMQGGLTVAEIAKRQGFTLDQLKTIMLDSFKSQIEIKKSNGLLTQAEADELYKTCINFIDDYLAAQPGSTVIKVGPTPSVKG